MTLSQPDRLDRIEALVEANARAIADLKQESQQLDKRLEEDAKRWDERFFQMNRDYGQTSRAIIITAGTVVIFSPVLQALAPAIEKVVSRLFE